ncbi:hypothetical protein BBJ28_00020170 [Nothophytophthora sp. Chile5]|nr:hypothetical protein BBJ28_00020170 [Nothophytophthora sp. Chile5]
MAPSGSGVCEDVIIQSGVISTTIGCSGGTEAEIKFDNAALADMHSRMELEDITPLIPKTLYPYATNFSQPAGTLRSPKIERSPKIVADNSKDMVHTAENFWDDNTNHAFELNSSAYVLAESKYFYNITTSLKDDSGYIFVPTSDQTDFESYLGRDCVVPH